MIFSDLSGLTGMVQRAEAWTGLGNGAISGSPVKLKQFCENFNEAFDDVMPLVLSLSDTLRWDDKNNTDFPVASFNLVSGQYDYTALTDADALDILNIIEVAILQSSGSTTYVKLQKITLDDARAPLMMSQNAANTGIPSAVLIKGNTIFFDVIPNYSATNGIKIFFEREQVRFLPTTADTREAGIPVIFHPLLVQKAALQWLVVNKSSSAAIPDLRDKIARSETRLNTMISQKNRTRRGVRANVENTK